MFKINIEIIYYSAVKLCFGFKKSD